MFELFVVGYFRFMFVYFWCEQCFFFQKCFIIDRVESYWVIYVYGNRSFCLDFFLYEY